MYILPNDRKITEADVEFMRYALRSKDESVFFVFNIKTGGVLTFFTSRKRTRKQIEASKHYFVLPRVTDQKVRGWIVEYSESSVGELSPQLQAEITSLGAGDAELVEIMALMDEDKTGAIHGWDHYFMCKLDERLEQWFVELPIRIRDDYSQMYEGDSPVAKKLRQLAREQDDREYFGRQLEVADDDVEDASEDSHKD
jgi:hypothetical protein